MGFDRKNGSMEALCEPIEEKMGEEYACIFHRMTRLNACALFSSHVMTQEQREELLNFRKATIEQLNAGSKWWKRIWMKWIRCLY